MPEPSGRKVVPERNPLKPTPLTREPQIVRGRDPRFHYEWFSTDPSHPSYYGHKERRHEIGDPATGYLMCEAWQFVSQETDPNLKVENPRDDQGANLDTAHRWGDLVYMRTTVENHANYTRMHDEKVRLNSKDLTDGARQDFGVTSSSAVVSPDPNANVDALLKGIS